MPKTLNPHDGAKVNPEPEGTLVQAVNLNGDDSYYGGTAIEQLNAHETIGPDESGGIFIPFHAIDFAIVESRGVTPYTPEDANCEDVVADCSFFQMGAFIHEGGPEQIEDGYVFESCHCDVLFLDVAIGAIVVPEVKSDGDITYYTHSISGGYDALYVQANESGDCRVDFTYNGCTHYIILSCSGSSSPT